MTTRSRTIIFGNSSIITGTLSGPGGTARRQFGLQWSGPGSDIDLGRKYQPGSTELIVNHQPWILRTAETEIPDIWEYEELSGNQSIRLRYPESIGVGEPIVVRYISA